MTHKDTHGAACTCHSCAPAPRPTQVCGPFMAELRYPAILGGGTRTLGPMRSADLRRAIVAARAPYPGEAQPSVRTWEVRA